MLVGRINVTAIEQKMKKSAWRWTEQKMEKMIPVIWFAENCKKGMYMILQH
jgi:hypothetical protein